MRLRSWMVGLLLLGGTPALAADVALNVGLLEVVTLPQPAHAGLYPSVGVSLALPVGPTVLIPSLAAEWSFDQGRGGLVLGATLDVPLGRLVGVDLNLFLIHDMPGLELPHSIFFLGGGPGLSLFLGRWTLSVSLGLFTALGTWGLSLAPGLNLAWTLPWSTEQPSRP